MVNDMSPKIVHVVVMLVYAFGSLSITTIVL